MNKIYHNIKDGKDQRKGYPMNANIDDLFRSVERAARKILTKKINKNGKVYWNICLYAQNRRWI